MDAWTQPHGGVACINLGAQKHMLQFGIVKWLRKLLLGICVERLKYTGAG
jgi:hypothetical protein